MAEYLIQSEDLTSIADKIRVLSGTEDDMSLGAMETKLDEANVDVNTEADLISQIMVVLNNKTDIVIPEVKIGTATAKLSSNGTSISFTGLTEEPEMFAISPTGNITLGSTRYVTSVMYDGSTTRGTYGYRSGSSATSYHSSSYFTWTYSNGTLTVKTSSSTNGGNFSSSVTYQLAYVTTVIKESISGELQLPVLSTSYPEDATVAMGGSVTAETVISQHGNPNTYTYQWYRNGTAISGATNINYTFTPTEAGTTTLYCNVTNEAGTVTSRTATITVTNCILYEVGNEHTDITGGWTLSGYSSGESGYSVYAGTKGSNGITLNGRNNYYVMLGTNNQVDLTSFSKLKVRGKPTSTSSSTSIWLGIRKNKVVDVNDAAYVDFGTNTQLRTIELDISRLSGSYYIYVSAGANSECSGYINLIELV